MNKLCTVSKNNSDAYIVNSAYFGTLVIEETKSGKVNAYKEGGKCFFKGLELLEDERDIMKLSDYVKETQTKYVARMTAKLPTMCAALHL